MISVSLIKRATVAANHYKLLPLRQYQATLSQDWLCQALFAVALSSACSHQRTLALTYEIDNSIPNSYGSAMDKLRVQQEIGNIGKYRRASSEDDDPSGVITHRPALDARLNIVHMLMETRRP